MKFHFFLGSGYSENHKMVQKGTGTKYSFQNIDIEPWFRICTWSTEAKILKEHLEIQVNKKVKKNSDEMIKWAEI